MTQLSDDDYYTLEHFVRAVAERVRDGVCSAGEATTDLMHALSAWDNGNWQEFGPWMQLRLDSWRGGDGWRTN